MSFWLDEGPFLILSFHRFWSVYLYKLNKSSTTMCVRFSNSLLFQDGIHLFLNGDSSSLQFSIADYIISKLFVYMLVKPTDPCLLGKGELVGFI